MGMKPLIDTTKDIVLQDDDMKTLSQKPQSLPIPKVPTMANNVPASLASIIPGATSHDQQGPSTSYAIPTTPASKKLKTNLFQKKGRGLNNPKETRSKKIEQKKTSKARKKSAQKRIREIADDVSDECPSCSVKWEDMDESRNIQCNGCSFWFCELCSDSLQLVTQT